MNMSFCEYTYNTTSSYLWKLTPKWRAADRPTLIKLIWSHLVWLSCTLSSLYKFQVLPCFLGPPGSRSWQADNVLILGRPGGNTLGLPEEAHLLRFPAGRWEPLPQPLCVWDKRMSWAREKARGGSGGVYNTEVENHLHPPKHWNLLSWDGIMIQRLAC